MKVLIIKTSSLGDVIHTLPALSDAQAAIPKIEFDWVIEEGFAQVPTWHSAVKQVIPIALRRWRKNKSWVAVKEMLAFIKKLRSQNYDYIIDAQGLIKSAVITRLTHGEKCGLNFNSAREKVASFFYGQKIAVAKEQHAITRVRKLFAQILHYPIKKEVDYGIKSFFTIPKEHDKSLIFVHGSSHPHKCWEEYKWIELARLASAKGFEIKLPWGNALELKRAQKIAALSNAQVLPQTALHELALIFLKSSGVIAVDTGLGHLAAALDVPTVSLYQNTNPALIGTIGARCEKVQNLSTIPVSEVWEKVEGVKK